MAGVHGTPSSPTAYIHRAGLSEWLNTWEMPASFAEGGSWGRESRRRKEKREGARQAVRSCGLGRAGGTRHTPLAHPGPHCAQGETCSQHRGSRQPAGGKSEVPLWRHSLAPGDQRRSKSVSIWARAGQTHPREGTRNATRRPREAGQQAARQGSAARRSSASEQACPRPTRAERSPGPVETVPKPTLPVCSVTERTGSEGHAVLITHRQQVLKPELSACEGRGLRAGGSARRYKHGAWWAPLDVMGRSLCPCGSVGLASPAPPGWRLACGQLIMCPEPIRLSEGHRQDTCTQTAQGGPPPPSVTLADSRGLPCPRACPLPPSGTVLTCATLPGSGTGPRSPDACRTGLNNNGQWLENGLPFPRGHECRVLLGPGGGTAAFRHLRPRPRASSQGRSRSQSSEPTRPYIPWGWSTRNPQDL